VISAPDAVVKVGDSLLQHGKFSDRVYLMRLHPPDATEVLDAMESLAGSNAYTKLFAKVPKSASDLFLERGYELEASVPRLFQGEEGLFLVRYPDPRRRKSADMDIILKVLERCREARRIADDGAESESRELGPEDAEQLADVYREVFQTYPFPIQDPGYLRRTMKAGFRYFGMDADPGLCAVSSFEPETERRCAEMTDFATRPAFRGRRAASVLLRRMEGSARDAGIETAFTIARSVSFGMNLTFARRGYTFAGTLYNNTNIGGSIESMNVWYKPLAGPGD